MWQGDTLTWLLGDYLGSATITATENGTLASEQKYTAWGQTRSGSVGTDRQYTGQISEPQLRIYFYNARYYDPYLNRFLSPDILILSAADPQSWDRYSYVNNNPINYSDPTGHIRTEEGDDIDLTNYWTYQERTKTNSAKAKIWKSAYQPSSNCFSDPVCHDSYDTFVQVVGNLGRIPSEEEIMMMTAGTEYYSYASYHKGAVRIIGQEALARNYFASCKLDDCQGDELYGFLGGYSPWFGAPYSVGDGSPIIRSRLLVNVINRGNSIMRSEMSKAINLDFAIAKGWTYGKEQNRPWQWYTFRPGETRNPRIGGYTSEFDAILSIDLGNGEVFWMFTGAQDAKFNPEDWK